MPIITPEWDKVLAHKLSNKPFLEKIQERLKSDLAAGKTICPKVDNIFRAYKLTSYQDVKVLIIGQDPFYSPKRADGLAFSSEYMTPSMDTIIKEIKGSTGKVRTKLTLDDWAEQGVMLLNASLTTVQGKPNAHEGLWETLTQYTVQRLSDRTKTMVVMLWGNYAIKFGSVIDHARHLVLKAPHPASDSYEGSAYKRTFVGCKHFEHCNDWMQTKGFKQINWGDPL